jgi:protein-S-isoprenylcysteine O-methyltransferase Ste14
LLGSLAFFVVAPGTVAGWVPYWLTRWRVEPPFLGVAALRVAGALLVLAGLASVVESFLRFALVGLGTPAPVAPTRHLVVSGQYRHVRNPMYVAVVAMIVGQAFVFGSVPLLQYAGVVWFAFHAFVRLYEEPTLVAQFGASYDAYRRQVRRWWPRLRRWGRPGEAQEER